jgi:glycerol-3-phosphate O-acyltransferase
MALERGRADFLSGRIALREALSKATLENAFSWMVSQGILAADDGKIRLGAGEGLDEVLAGIAPHLPD